MHPVHQQLALLFADCNRGGGVIEFVALRENVPVTRAAQLIAEWFALPLPPGRHGHNSQGEPP